MSRYLRQMPSERAGTLLPTQVHAIAQLFPALQRLDFIKKLRQRHPLPPDPNELRRVAFDAFKELLMRIASQEALVLFREPFFHHRALAVRVNCGYLRGAREPSRRDLAPAGRARRR